MVAIHLLFVLVKRFNLFHFLRQFFELQEIILCDLNDLGLIHVHGGMEAQEEVLWG